MSHMQNRSPRVELDCPIRVSALLFDLDGTLIDSKEDIALSVHTVQDEMGVPLSSVEEIGSFIGDGVDKLIERALGTVDMKRVASGVELFKGHYRDHCLDHTGLYPGVLDVLTFFQQKSLAVVTNKPYRITCRILEGLGIQGFFKAVLGGDSVARKKPDPLPIFEALRLLGDVPGCSAMIGDSAHDVLAGRAAGLWTCAIRSNISDPQHLLTSHPDFTVESLIETMRIFR